MEAVATVDVAAYSFSFPSEELGRKIARSQIRSLFEIRCASLGLEPVPRLNDA